MVVGREWVELGKACGWLTVLLMHLRVEGQLSVIIR